MSLVYWLNIWVFKQYQWKYTIKLGYIIVVHSFQMLGIKEDFLKQVLLYRQNTDTTILVTLMLLLFAI